MLQLIAASHDGVRTQLKVFLKANPGAAKDLLSRTAPSAHEGIESRQETGSTDDNIKQEAVEELLFGIVKDLFDDAQLAESQGWDRVLGLSILNFTN
jgi:hypothetical protein